MCAAGAGGRGRGVQACSKRARRSASLTLRCSVTLASSPAAWTSACGAAQGLSVAVTSAERRWWCAVSRVQGEMGCGASREGAGLQRLEALDVLAQPRVPAPREREVDADRPLAALLLGERAQRRHGEPQVLLALEAVDRDQAHLLTGDMRRYAEIWGDMRRYWGDVIESRRTGGAALGHASCRLRERSMHGWSTWRG